MERIRNFLKKIDRRYIIIIAIAIIIFAPYISEKFIKGDDYICHISNIFAIDKDISIDEGRLLPSKIRPVMANDMGYGNGIFYPQFSYYMVSYIYILIKQIGMTMISSIKIFEFLILSCSGIFMYKFVAKVFENKDVGMISAIMYMCTPYFCTDIFRRMALAEIPIFMFMPIVMLSIYYLFNKEYKKFAINFIIGYSGMICSHLVMTVYFTIFLAIILLLKIKLLFSKKAIFSFLITSIITILITSPYIFPMMEHKARGEYVVFEDSSMSGLDVLQKHQLSFDELISRDTRDAKTHTSLIVIAFIGITIIYRKKIIKDSIQKNIFLFICIFTVMSIIISSTIMNWEIIPKILWNIQFPWRMCTFIAFGTSIIAGLGILAFKSENRKILILIVCICCLYDASYTIHKLKIQKLQEVSFDEVASATSGALGWQKEYLPVKTLGNITYLEERNQDIISKYGENEIKLIKNKTPYLEFDIKINGEYAVVEIPRIFYYGYEIKLEKENGTKESIDYYENENGFIECKIQNSGNIKVEYKGTLINNISNLMSLVTIIVLILYMIVNKRNSEFWEGEKDGKEM